jgi:putative ABC transport system permease protein
MTMRELFARLRDWVRRDDLDRELVEELRFHQTQLERDVRAAGEGSDAVARVAHRRLGNVTSVRETARDYWSVPSLDHAQQDLRYAFRGLRRSPGFTSAVILTLGLGIGANVAMLNIVDRLMFRSFPFLRDPASVQRVYLQSSYRGQANTRSNIEYTTYLDLRRWTSSFSQYAAVTEWRLAVGQGDAARERQVAGVSASFFDFFDARPALGRFFDASDDVLPRGASVAVLGYSYWQTELGGENVLGRTLQVGPLPVTIVGVAPKGFVGISEGEPPSVILPITTMAYAVNQGNVETFFTKYSWTWMSAIVRRREGVTVTAASADLTNAWRRSRAANRRTNPRVIPDSIARPRAFAAALRTPAGPSAGLESRTLLWVAGVAAIVLLIACANVANLMFARVLRRRREIAVRLAIGVSRGRLVAQFLIESLLLAGLGCIAGVLIAQIVAAGLHRLLAMQGSTLDVISDWRTLAAGSAFALASAFLTAVGPALLAVRGDLAPALRAGAREGTYQRSRARTTLLILQAALSVVLLVGAGLFVRSLGNVRAMPLGWEPDRVLLVTPNYRGLTMDSSGSTAFRRRLLATAQSIAGVEAATRVNSLPFATNTFDLHVAGIDSVARLGRFNYQATTGDYFKVVGTRIIRGRAFGSRDRADTPPVAVVSESMGKALWPGRDPIGQCLHVRAETAPCTTVVGIAEDAVQQSIGDEERFFYYLSDEQPPFTPTNRLFLRVATPDALVAERVRRELQRIMPGQAYVTVTPLEDLVDTQRLSWTLGATMFAAFGVLALIVAAVGLYGVIAYGVAQRMHELGVRIALGAGQANIVRLVVGQGIAFAVSGVAIGLGATLVAARWVEPLLFRESARDPFIYGGVGIVIVLVALLASAAPAMRATRADPNAALRSD